MNDDRLVPYGALLLRVSMGVMFVAYGLVLKVMTYGVAGTAGYFESIGYPAALAYLVIAAEIGGGVALILGLFTRLVSLALVPLMIGATLQHAGNGWTFSAEGGGWSFPLFWIAALLAQALLGDGAHGLTGKVRGALGLRPSPLLA